MALQSGHEGYVLRLASCYGSWRRSGKRADVRAGLASVTLDAAKLLGVDKRIGSLDAGKDADIAMYDGDPFEYTSHCVGVIVNARSSAPASIRFL